MAKVITARDAYLAARQEVTRARLALGQAIAEARAENVDQAEIARKLKLTREQIRRYQDEYEKKAGIKAEKPRPES